MQRPVPDKHPGNAQAFGPLRNRPEVTFYRRTGAGSKQVFLKIMQLKSYTEHSPPIEASPG